MDDGLTPMLVKRDGLRGWRRINKKDFDPAKHEIYTPPPPAAAVQAPPPLPPPPVDPLASLPPNWRDATDTTVLRTIAAGIDGRNPENREQAVQMIAAALAANQ